MKKRLLLLDGHSQAYRACFSRMAGDSLRAPDGRTTTGPYVFTKILMKMIAYLEPTHVVVARDGPRHELHRRALYSEYKKGRKEVEPDIDEQIRLIYRIIEALQIRVIIHKGWEADDVIATLVRRFSGKAECIIVSSDKDLHQLVKKGVKFYDPRTHVLRDHVDIEQLWGIEPGRIVDCQTLMGDSTDNIPGVRGLGQVSAVDLVTRFINLEVLQNSLHMLPSARAKSIRDTDLELMRKLVELNQNLEIDVKLKDLKYTELRLDGARALFTELGFTRWIDQ